MVTVLLMLYRVRGAILIGIFLTSIVSWPRSTAVTYFPPTDAGDAAFDTFKKIVTIHRLEKIGNVISVSLICRFEVCQMLSNWDISTNTGKPELIVIDPKLVSIGVQ